MKISIELIASTAEEFCKKECWSTEQAADLVNAIQIGATDGYRLAKVLEQNFNWSPTTQDVQILDNFIYELRWAAEREGKS